MPTVWEVSLWPHIGRRWASSPALGIWAWLWPTAVGTPLIYYYSKRYSTA